MNEGPSTSPYGQPRWSPAHPSPPTKSMLRWLWIPGVVALLSIALPVAVIAANVDELDVATDDGVSGPPDGLSVVLVEGHRYWLYTDVPAVAASCTVMFGAEQRSVTLSRSSSSLTPEPDEPRYELLGSFVAPDGGVAALSCPVDADELVILPDDSVLAWVGLAGIAGAIGFLGSLAAAIVIIVVWSNRRKRAAQPPIGAWYGQPPPGVQYQPSPQVQHAPPGWSAPEPDRPEAAQPQVRPQPGASGPSAADPWAPPTPATGDDESGAQPRK